MFFVSFSSKDKKFVEKIVSDIEKKGFSCWASYKDIPPGGNYQDSIVKAINECKAVIIVCSKDSDLSPEVSREMALASQFSKNLLPVRCYDFKPVKHLAYILATSQFIDLFGNDYIKGMHVLLQALADDMKGDKGFDPRKYKLKFSFFQRVNFKKIGIFSTLTAIVIGISSFFYYNPTIFSAKDSSHPPAVLADNDKKAAPQEGAVDDDGDYGEESAKHVSDTVVDQLLKTSPSMREGEITKVLSDGNRLTYKQGRRLLSGASDGVRSSLIRSILPGLKTPVPVPVMMSYLKMTGIFWRPTLEEASASLADNLTASEVLALLGPLSEGERENALRVLIGHIDQTISVEAALKMLHGTDSFRETALSRIASKLPTPLAANDALHLMNDMTPGDRDQALRLLSPLLPPVISPNEAFSLLKPLDTFYSDGLDILKEHLPTDLSVQDVLLLLGSTEDGNRDVCLQHIVSHLKDGIKGQELASILKGTNSFWNESAQRLTAKLSDDQSALDIKSILGPTTGANRFYLLNTIKGVIPNNLTFDDTKALLKNIDSSYTDALELLIPHIAPLTHGNIDLLLQPLGDDYRKATLQKKLLNLQ